MPCWHLLAPRTHDPAVRAERTSGHFIENRIGFGVVGYGVRHAAVEIADEARDHAIEVDNKPVDRCSRRGMGRMGDVAGGPMGLQLNVESENAFHFVPVEAVEDGEGSVAELRVAAVVRAALDDLVDLASRLGTDEIRLSPARGFVLLLKNPSAADLTALAENFIVAPDDPRRSVAACTGAPACASGSTSTLADAALLAQAFGSLAAEGRSAHVSGCAKGCAKPGPADLTLIGRAGLYGTVIGGAPGDEPAMHLPIEAVLERLGRAKTIGLSAAFAPDRAGTDIGRTRRPA